MNQLGMIRVDLLFQGGDDRGEIFRFERFLTSRTEEACFFEPG